MCTAGDHVKRFQRKLLYQMTKQDELFMKNLMAGVRAARDKAMGKPEPVIVRKAERQP